MSIINDHVTASKGHIFVLTEKGYEKTPEHVKAERAVGKPIRGFEYRVPVSWVENGYVVIERQSCHFID